MPWTCPNCGLNLGVYAPHQSLPRSDDVYRCPVCHLEMRFDAITKKMQPLIVPPDPKKHKTA